MIKVLFVCLGNICRSPLAEGVFAHLVKQHQLQDRIFCDSAGTSSYHIGEPADPRSRNIAACYGIQLTHLARQFSLNDFKEFHYVIVMDHKNLAEIRLAEQRYGDHNCQIFLLREFEQEAIHPEVADPYWGNDDAFEECYQTVLKGSQGLLEFIRKEHSL